MTVFRIALLQSAASGGDLEASRREGLRLCAEAADLGADLCLFPEMWSIGYSIIDPGFVAWDELALTLDDPYVQDFRDLARSRGVGIGLTFLERSPAGYRNTLAVIGKNGEIVLVYAKVHIVLDTLEARCVPGDGFQVADFDLGDGESVRLGAMICYDREFPESARVLALQGAEIIVTPNACELERHRLEQFRTRAFENMVGMAMTNYPRQRQGGSWPASGPDNMNGRSTAISPVAFDLDNGTSADTVIVEAGSDEGIYLAEFDLEELREYRSRGTWGDKRRRPDAYTVLTET